MAIAPWLLTSLNNVGNASSAPAAAALSACLSGGLLQLFGNTKCVPHLQAKQRTHEVQVMEGRQQIKGMSAFVSWWLIRSICGGQWPASLFLVRAECYCILHTMDHYITTIPAPVTNTDSAQIQMWKTKSSSVLLVKAVWLTGRNCFQWRHDAIIWIWSSCCIILRLLL